MIQFKQIYRKAALAFKSQIKKQLVTMSNVLISMWTSSKGISFRGTSFELKYRLNADIKSESELLEQNALF